MVKDREVWRSETPVKMATVLRMVLCSVDVCARMHAYVLQIVKMWPLSPRQCRLRCLLRKLMSSLVRKSCIIDIV